MDNWDEVKTAFQVARLGTVSGAAEVLGVHHATVIRHIDSLEARLGIKLFQRHARGYTATEAGEDLMRVAKTTDEQFAQLVGRIKGRGTEVCGDIVVTSLVSLANTITPVLVEFQRQNPGVVVRYLTDQRLFRLEYGEAHVAIRAGSAPDQPDNVVQPLLDLEMAAYASEDYVARRGKPSGLGDYAGHQFAGPEDRFSRAPYFRWLASHVPEEQVTFRASDTRALETAILAGAGIGFLPVIQEPAARGLIEIHPPQPEWTAPLWLVTHVDLHRTTKVQALLQFLKQHVTAQAR